MPCYAGLRIPGFLFIAPFGLAPLRQLLPTHPLANIEASVMVDILIIGAGPAGLTAAIYARRAEKSVLVLEKETFGGQITFSPLVENIPGFAPVSGNEFSEKLVEQAMNQGAEFDFGEVLRIEDGPVKKVYTDSAVYEAKSVVIATGAKHRLIGAENEEKFIGNGISFCAVCDGAFYRGKKVAVIGGGNSALQEAILLSEAVSELIVVQNLPFLTGEKKLADELLAKPNVRVIYSTVVSEYLGETDLTGIKVLNTETNTESVLTLDGVFVAIGLIPQNEAFKEWIQLDERGYAASDEQCLTKTVGIFVAGDCRSKRIRQVTTACADGAVAALAACSYLENA